jgi:glutamyl-tRNA reductase
LEPCLVVVGLNYRTAPVEVRERFWMSDARADDALRQLRRMDGIQEVLVLATCYRTEFILWASDFSAAANSVLTFLGREYGLRLCEWKHFYRLLGEEALLHVFRVTSRLDSMVLGDARISNQVAAAWAKAQQANSSGRLLDSIVQKALALSERVRSETAIQNPVVSVPWAAVELAKEIFGSLEGRKPLVLGAGKMGELAARHLVTAGAAPVKVADPAVESAQTLAQAVGGQAFSFEERWPAMLDADLVISATSSPHLVIARDEAERLVHERQGRSLFFIDLAMPRDIDPAIRELPGMFLYDMDDVERVVARTRDERQVAAAEAESLVAAEAAAFRRALASERVGPTILALRERLDEISRQELDRYAREFGPLNDAQRDAFQVLCNRIVHQIAGSLVRELKESPETPEQERLATAVRRLFHLELPPAAPTVH